jgi:hypothetical protein
LGHGKKPFGSNHTFHHWWKSTAARVEMQDSLADAIQGHAGRSVASNYRHFDLETLAKGVEARCKNPRWPSNTEAV